jgi:hypothetical protein
MYLLRAMAEQMEARYAEGSLRRFQEIAVGTGSTRKSDAERILSGWQRAADRQGTVRAQTVEERRAMAAALGFTVPSSGGGEAMTEDGT